MWRILIDELLIFLIPFALYLVYRSLAVRRDRPALRSSGIPLMVATALGGVLAFSVLRRAEGTMVRMIIDGLLVFLVPFALWWGFHALRLRDPKAAMTIERGPLAWLTAAGLVLCIASIIVAEMMSPPHQAGYQRAVWKDGKLIQGEAK